MLKRKKYMVSLLIIALSVSFINSNAALAVSDSTSEDFIASSYNGTGKIGLDKNNIKWSYELCSDGTVSIKKTKDSDLSGEIEIPSKLEGRTVSSIGDEGLRSLKKITSVKIPATVKSIGEMAFFACTSLNNIEIPSSVTNIGNGAFEKTPWLTNKRKLNSLVVVNNILVDGRDATGNITIPSNVTSIADGAFTWLCVDHDRYGNSDKITSVVIPEGVKKIGEYAFLACYNLSNIEIPSSVIEIKSNAFSGTPWIEVLQQNNEFVIINNILISAGANAAGDVTIPSNVVSISPNSFDFSNGITSIKIPNGIKEIEKNTFYYCENLKRIDIPLSVTSIGESSFSGCKSLGEISIPDSVVNIGSYAFDGCESLNNVILSKNIKNIKKSTFWGCSNLTYIDIPSGVTTIEDNAFESCDKLEKVRIPASVTEISDSAFDECGNLIAIYCDKSSYSSNYFKNKGISVQEYDKYSADNSDIQLGSTGTITDKNNIKWKYKSLSDGTLSIAIIDNSINGNVEIPSELNGYKVTALDERAFHDCKYLTSVKIPEGVKSIGKDAFRWCEKITSIEIPLSVTNIGENAFSCCECLSSVNIPNKEVSLDGEVCSYNTKVNIGVSNATSNGSQTPATTGNTLGLGQTSTTLIQGWHKNGERWNWLWSDGSKRNGWYSEGDNWYYFYGNGEMATEFIDLGGFSYYFKPNPSDGKAAMVIGWQYIGGHWFYFNPNSDGYKGLMKRACWANIGGNWYYFYYDGTMAHNAYINEYYVNSSGVWVK